MFILRRISSHGIEMNKALGENYTYIARDRNYEEFQRAFKECYNMEYVPDDDPKSNDDTKNCYAFVANGSVNQPLFTHQKNFIMTECGKTFANLSNK